jgi:hypothetical protein
LWKRENAITNITQRENGIPPKGWRQEDEMVVWLVLNKKLSFEGWDQNWSELYLYSSPSIIRMIKSKRMRWAGHVARMGEKRNAHRILVGKRPLGRPRLGGWTILKWILENRMGWYKLDRSGWG